MDPTDLCIFCATDDRFARPLSVTLTTLLAVNSGPTINLVVALIDVSAANVEKLKRVCSRPGVIVSFKPFDMSPFHAYPTCDTISCAAYARIFAPQFLPGNWTKALYLDCDLLIRKSLDELWKTDVSGYAVAGVQSPCYDPEPLLGIPPGGVYVNSGVLLLNLVYWRENQVSVKLQEFVRKNPTLLPFLDQDAINACLHHKTLLIPPEWNVMHSFFLEPWTRLRKLPLKQIKRLRSDPSIVHFTGPTKPWKYSTVHPFQGAWLAALALTPFECPSERPNATDLVRKQAKLFGRPIKRALRATLHLSGDFIASASALISLTFRAGQRR